MAIGNSWSFQTTLTEVQCGQCGGVYALSERYRREKFEKGGFWTCPYCKTQWGYAEGENDKLKRQLEQQRQRTIQESQRADYERAEREHQARRAAAARGQATKAKKSLARVKDRVANGVCPCCHRTFTNLARHMAGQHPDWADRPESTE